VDLLVEDFTAAGAAPEVVKENMAGTVFLV
jgi:hypothetical protein